MGRARSMQAALRPTKNNKNKGNDMTWLDEASQMMDEVLRRLAAREARARLERDLQRAAQEFDASI